MAIECDDVNALLLGRTCHQNKLDKEYKAHVMGGDVLHTNDIDRPRGIFYSETIGMDCSKVQANKDIKSFKVRLETDKKLPMIHLPIIPLTNFPTTVINSGIRGINWPREFNKKYTPSPLGAQSTIASFVQASSHVAGTPLDGMSRLAEVEVVQPAPEPNMGQEAPK